MSHRNGADLAPNDVCQFTNRNTDVVWAEIVGTTRGVGGESGDDPDCDVLHIDERPGLEAVARDRDRLTTESRRHKSGHCPGRASARTIGNAEAQYHRR